MLALGSDRDVPDEPQKFASDRSYRLILVLPARCEFHVTLVQAILSLSGDFFNFFGEFEITLSSKQISADPRSVAGMTMQLPR
jgi:hypothetical protein